MKYRKFGNLDWEVSALGFGCMRLPIGDDDWVDQQEAERLLSHAVDNGVNFIDTAWLYHAGQSEVIAGNFLNNGYRDRVRLATKLPSWKLRKKKDLDRYLKKQLHRMQQDYFDFYILQGLNSKFWEKLKRMHVLEWAENKIREGKTRHLGFSFHDDYEVFEDIIGAYDWALCELKYNILDCEKEAGTRGVGLAAKKGVAVVAVSPLRGGELADPSPPLRDIWDHASDSKTPSDYALRWLWDQEEVSTVLSGMSTYEQVEDNLKSASDSGPGILSDAEHELIDRVRSEYEKNRMPVRICTESKKTKEKDKVFRIELIHPSRYDDDGYIVQWRKSWVPSNTLAVMNSLMQDASRREVCGQDVTIEVRAWEENNTVLPLDTIVREASDADRTLVCMVGVQTNQFPRATDIARLFRDAGIDVAIGGFHVSGSLAMLSEIPSELTQAIEEGITLFAGEAEGHLDEFLIDAWNAHLKPIYNHLNDLPSLEGAPLPYMPLQIRNRQSVRIGTFDTSRGCPFKCKFCTIINVQGRKPRARSPEDIEQLVRRYYAEGVDRFFITDDNFSRSPIWEDVLDRFISMNQNEGIQIHFVVQVDANAYKVPNFVRKLRRARCIWVFIGMESINPENLASANKGQNRISEFREMLRVWHQWRILTQVGYILGFPADTPESIHRDVETLKSELPIDFVKFACLMPLPGSEDHREMVARGEWIDPDLNKFTGEKPLTRHPKMTMEQWDKAFWNAWNQYYSWPHAKTIIRRAESSGPNSVRVVVQLFREYLSFRYERLQPLEGGYLRIKGRTRRRPGMKNANPLLFYPRRMFELLSINARALFRGMILALFRRYLQAFPSHKNYSDEATGELNRLE